MATIFSIRVEQPMATYVAKQAFVYCYSVKKKQCNMLSNKNIHTREGGRVGQVCRRQHDWLSDNNPRNVQMRFRGFP